VLSADIFPSSKAQYKSYKIPAATSVRSQTKLFYTFTSNLFTIYFNISFRVCLKLASDFFPPVPPRLPEDPSNSDFISYTLLSQILMITGHILNFFHIWRQTAYPVKQRTLYPTYLNKAVKCQFNNTETCSVVALCRIQL